LFDGRTDVAAVPDPTILTWFPPVTLTEPAELFRTWTVAARLTVSSSPAPFAAVAARASLIVPKAFVPIVTGTGDWPG
jgi:hypothetical protein